VSCDGGSGAHGDVRGGSGHRGAGHSGSHASALRGSDRGRAARETIAIRKRRMVITWVPGPPGLSCVYIDKDAPCGVGVSRDRKWGVARVPWAGSKSRSLDSLGMTTLGSHRFGGPHPPVFFVRVANKGLRLDAASRASRGERRLTVDPSTPLRAGSLKLKGENAVDPSIPLPSRLRSGLTASRVNRAGSLKLKEEGEGGPPPGCFAKECGSV